MQKKLVDLRRGGRIPDCLILTEHDPVITMGRASSMDNLLCSREELTRRGVELIEIERGGDITFHGPGQIVAYPILDLNNRGRDLHRYLRDLEAVVTAALEGFGLRAVTKDGLTGVWVDDHKLGAIGVAVSRWISYHGVAVNVNTDLDFFKLINPCGITRYPVGSVSSMLGSDIDMAGFTDTLADNFAELFYYEMEKIDNIDDLVTLEREI